MSRVPLFAIGTLVSFVSGWIAAEWLIRFLSHHTLTAFGWYPMAVAALVLWKV